MGWNKDNALGKEIYPGWEDKKKYKIIGVLKDFYVNGVDKPVEPILFFNYDRNWAKNNMSNLQIKLSGDDIDGTLERIKQFWLTKAEPGYPFEYEFVDKQFAKTFEKFQKQQTLFTILNIVVLLVALLGLFALSSLLIEQKLKDVAIKKTLGEPKPSHLPLRHVLIDPNVLEAKHVVAVIKSVRAGDLAQHTDTLFEIIAGQLGDLCKGRLFTFDL
jgi:putative ABC transport system permease protein